MKEGVIVLVIHSTSVFNIHLVRARHYFRWWGFRDGDRGLGRDQIN